MQFWDGVVNPNLGEGEAVEVGDGTVRKSVGDFLCLVLQEAQLPQRNSASAAHMEGAKPSSPLPAPPLATPMRTVESESRNKRTPSVPSVKRTLS